MDKEFIRDMASSMLRKPTVDLRPVVQVVPIVDRQVLNGDVFDKYFFSLNYDQMFFGSLDYILSTNSVGNSMFSVGYSSLTNTRVGFQRVPAFFQRYVFQCVNDFDANISARSIYFDALFDDSQIEYFQGVAHLQEKYPVISPEDFSVNRYAVGNVRKTVDTNRITYNDLIFNSFVAYKNMVTTSTIEMVLRGYVAS